MDYYNTEHPILSWLPPWMQAATRTTPRATEWRTLLYELLFSVYEITLPENWLPSPFRWMLFGWGSLGVVYSKEFGWVYGTYAVTKKDWQYTPLKFCVTLPYESAQIDGIRGINGAIIHVRDCWRGFDQLVNQYADLLTSCDKGVDVSAKQTRYGKIIGVDDKKAAEELKQAYAKSDDGDPITFVSKRLLTADGKINITNLMGDLSQEYKGDKLMETRLMILKDYLTRIGVRTVGLEKREHLLNQEIAENNDETGASPYVVMTNLEPELKLLNAMGCDLKIKPRYDYSGAGLGKEENDGDKQNSNADSN